MSLEVGFCDSLNLLMEEHIKFYEEVYNYFTHSNFAYEFWL